MITYRRIQHAAHYGNSGQGHDLEEWCVPDELVRRSARTGNPVAPDSVPFDAEYHCGYLHEGKQFWVFVRRAPLSGGRCKRCHG